MKKKVIIIDDEHLARLIIREYLQDFPQLELIAECENGFDGAKKINELKPDLVFLDIQMPKITGFEMLEIITENPAIIFTTAFDEFALKAFDANALDYLLKPFSEERFKAAIDKFEKSSSETKEKTVNLNISLEGKLDRIVIRDSNEISIIPTAEIAYLEANDDYVKIFTAKNRFLKKKTLSFYAENLDEKLFIRIHRSFILNINFLTNIESFEKNSYLAILSSGAKIPISRTMYPFLKARLGI
jgi:two-component system LytT family response regulator